MIHGSLPGNACAASGGARQKMGSVVVKSLQIESSYTLLQAGDMAGAMQCARAALEQAGRTGDSALQAAALVCLAQCHDYLGHFDRAVELANTASECAPPHSHARADALRLLGVCAHERGDLDAAENYCNQAIDLARENGHPQVLMRCLHGLAATVYIPRGQFELALAADQEALRLAQQEEPPTYAWFPLTTLGWVYWTTGRRPAAEETLAALRKAAPPGSLAEGYYFCLLADVTQDQENGEEAPRFYALARSIAETIGDPGLAAELRVGLSRYHRSIGEAAAAHQWADDALAIAAGAGSHDLQGWAYIERARAAWELGRPEQAEADLLAAHEVLAPMEAHYDLARVYLLLAAMRVERDPAGAQAAWVEAASRIVSGGYAFLLERERALALPLLAGFLSSSDAPVASITATLMGHLERVPPPPLTVQTLGSFAVKQGLRPVPDQAWRQRRAGELFRYLLLLPGRHCHQEQVVEALWADRPPHSSLPLFHRATSALRRALEPDLPDKFPSRYLQVDQGVVTLHLPAGSQIDYEQVEQAVRRQEWEQVLALYGGDLFPADRYADWAAAPRERLRQMALQAALAVAQQCEAEGRPAKGLAAARQALEWEPWQEEAALLAMRTCVAQGNRAEALRIYQALAGRLRDELGVEPQAKLQAYYDALTGRGG